MLFVVLYKKNSVFLCFDPKFSGLKNEVGAAVVSSKNRLKLNMQRRRSIPNIDMKN